MNAPAAPVAFDVDAQAGDYLQDPPVRVLVEFFRAKGAAALIEEDRAEGWYADWIAHQAEKKIYARLLCAKAYSSLGREFDLFKLCRFMEAFAYFSPAHGYSLQVSFLGIFPFWMSANEALKKEAAAALEAGGLFAFGLSEKAHGSDLYGNETILREVAPGRRRADGAKFYIGNSNAASLISVLAAVEKPGRAGKRKPFAFFALRPAQAPGMSRPVKIRTMGVKTAFVGGFELKGHELPDSDMLCEGRAAWEAVFGTVTLGKFFLGFGSIGICERALQDALAHARGRVLYGKPAADMSHLRSAFAHAYARLAAMKLYAYRSLDYLRTASAGDRRYLLWNCVQKAKVSTEGVEVVRTLSECIGAKAFEADGRFESALRDIQLIPGLEGSTHINYAMAAQFVKNFLQAPAGAPAIGSLLAGTLTPGENPYLFAAETGGFPGVPFADPRAAFARLSSVDNAALFSRQAAAFAAASDELAASLKEDIEGTIALGKCVASIAYATLIAENMFLLKTPPALASVVFHQLCEDLSVQVLRLSGLPFLSPALAERLRGAILTPRASADDVAAVADLCATARRV